MSNFQSSEKLNSTDNKRGGIPLRFFLIFNSFFAFIIVYANKVVLSVAIVAMVSDTQISTTTNNNLILNSPKNNSNLNINSDFAAALHSGNNVNLDHNFNEKNISDIKNSPQFSTTSPTVAFKSPISNPDVQTKQQINQIHYKTAETKSKVLGAFFWGYIVTQVPAGKFNLIHNFRYILYLIFCSSLS